MPDASRKPRVLVIDDQTLIGTVIERCFGDDVDVVVETEGKAAYLRLLDPVEFFDVVFLDVMLPDMSGIEIYELLEVRAPRRIPRIVFITGAATRVPVTLQFIETKPNLVLEKPFEMEEIASVIRMFFSHTDPRGV